MNQDFNFYQDPSAPKQMAMGKFPSYPLPPSEGRNLFSTSSQSSEFLRPFSNFQGAVDLQLKNTKICNFSLS